MPYVYAIAFTNGIVKFGRTSNPYKRVKEHKTNGAQQGALPLVAFISTVSNDLREESMLLDEAYDRMEQVSRESFRYSGLEGIAAVFRECRLSYVACKISTSPFKLVVDNDSFMEDMSEFKPLNAGSKSAETAPNMRIRQKVAQVLRDSKPFTLMSIASRIPGVSERKVGGALSDMQDEGSIRIIREPGFEYSPYMTKYQETPIARQIYP